MVLSPTLVTLSTMLHLRVLPDSAPTTASQHEVRSRSGMVQQKGPVWESKWAAGKRPTGVANRTLLKSRRRGRASGASSRNQLRQQRPKAK
jgi:hypothetical protein